jgi:ABC-type anion transport system duplicated permease subunit
MTSLFFTNTLMLAGMAALAIPILVHLLLKRRKKQIQFSTLRFFQQQDEQSSRRRKLRNWLLLALRLLIVSLLVLAFSRPYSRQGWLAVNRKQRRVVSCSIAPPACWPLEPKASDGRWPRRAQGPF